MSNLNNLIIHIKGRLDNHEFFKGDHWHVVTLPAPDSYSQPSSIKFKSPQQLGSVGQEIESHVRMSGFVRKKDYKDKVTQQDKTYWESNVFFESVQAPVIPVSKAS